MIFEQIKHNPNKKHREIIADFKNDYCLNLSYDQAHAGKEECLKELYGEEANFYNVLKWFCDAVKETNPGSIADLVFDDAKK